MRKVARPKSEAFKKVEREVAEWRRTRKGRARMPEEIWSSVRGLYPEMTVYKISKGLGLNYTAVKTRIEKAEEDLPEPKGFVEIRQVLGGKGPARKIVRVELRSADGGQMSIEYPWEETTLVLKLAEALWGRKTCCN